jgi:sugar transferase (PEP-CTERM/EpsH1 system associated)
MVFAQSTGASGRMAEEDDARPLIVHFIYRLAMGGVESTLVHLINSASGRGFRHAVVCITDSTEFRERIVVSGVPIVELRKGPGLQPAYYLALWRTLRGLRPAIFHSRNLGPLAGQWVAALAGVPGRIHSEEGRDMLDLDGTNFRYNLVRRAMRFVVHQYVTVNRDLQHWLVERIGVPASRIRLIHNGVDIVRFQPRRGARRLPAPDGFACDDSFVIGNAGRMAEVKAPLLLVEAFLALIAENAETRRRLRLVMIGDGPLRERCLRRLAEAGAAELAWLPGERGDVAEILPGMDLFVLSSLVEGIPVAVLEAMACALPVVCPRVGGLPEIVERDVTGCLTEPGGIESLASGVRRYLMDPDLVRRHGAEARRRVVEQYSLERTLDAYYKMYEYWLGRRS